jgi:hypothetical protein
VPQDLSKVPTAPTAAWDSLASAAAGSSASASASRGGKHGQ